MSRFMTSPVSQFFGATPMRAIDLVQRMVTGLREQPSCQIQSMLLEVGGRGQTLRKTDRCHSVASNSDGDRHEERERLLQTSLT